MVSIDFFTVPTIRFQVLYVFLVLAHDRRRILHFNVTAHPTAEWTGQQLREAFPFDQLPPAARPRCYLRRCLPGTGARHGYPRSAVHPSIPLAAGLCRARHWFDSARVPGPARVPCKLASSYPSFVFGLLSPIENASLIKKGLAGTEIGPAGANGESRGAAAGRRAASPLRTTGRLRPCPPLI